MCFKSETSREKGWGERGAHLNLLVRHPVAHTRVELVETLPRLLGVGQVLGRLDRPLERTRPDLSKKKKRNVEPPVESDICSS